MPGGAGIRRRGIRPGGVQAGRDPFEVYPRPQLRRSRPRRPKAIGRRPAARDVALSALLAADPLPGRRRDQRRAPLANGHVHAFDAVAGRINDVIELAPGDFIHSVAVFHCIHQERDVLGIQMVLNDAGIEILLVTAATDRSRSSSGFAGGWRRCIRGWPRHASSMSTICRRPAPASGVGMSIDGRHHHVRHRRHRKRPTAARRRLGAAWPPCRTRSRIAALTARRCGRRRPATRTLRTRGWRSSIRRLRRGSRCRSMAAG